MARSRGELPFLLPSNLVLDTISLLLTSLLWHCRLPYVRTASEIQEMKFWRAPVRESHHIVDPIKRAKNHTSRVINMQLSKLSSVTRQASLDFPALKRMHPFERVRHGGGRSGVE